MASDRKHDREEMQDEAVEETFPASDPPASMSKESSARAVPPDRLMEGHRPPPADAVTLRRRFPTMESAKLALEGLVRDGPVDRSTAELVRIGKEIELRVRAEPEDCHRIRGLLAHA